MANRIQIRRDTAANWTSANPILAQAEIGEELDTKKAKIGDGTTAWVSLDYWVVPNSVPITTLGDTIYGAALGVPTRLPGNVTNTQLFLAQTGNGTISAAPSWQPLPVQGQLIYYKTSTASDVATYFKETTTPQVAANTATFAGVTDGQLLRTYITEPGNPNRTLMPAGEYAAHIHAAQTSGTKVTKLRTEVWETTSAGVDIVKLADLGPSIALTGSQSEYIIAQSNIQYTLASTSSRLATKVYAVVSGGGSAPTVAIYTGDNADTNDSFPGPVVDATNFVPYVGSTANLDLGSTFKVINAIDPTAAQDYATKNYVDKRVDLVSYTQFGGF